jgi:hypothetical protein
VATGPPERAGLDDTSLTQLMGNSPADGRGRPRTRMAGKYWSGAPFSPGGHTSADRERPSQPGRGCLRIRRLGVRISSGARSLLVGVVAQHLGDEKRQFQCLLDIQSRVTHSPAVGSLIGRPAGLLGRRLGQHGVQQCPQIRRQRRRGRQPLNLDVDAGISTSSPSPQVCHRCRQAARLAMQ